MGIGSDRANSLLLPGIRQISTRHIHRKSLQLLEGMELGSHLWKGHNGVHGLSGLERAESLNSGGICGLVFHHLCIIVDSNMKTSCLTCVSRHNCDSWYLILPSLGQSDFFCTFP